MPIDSFRAREDVACNTLCMMEALGCEFDAFEVCLAKPGAGPFYEYAAKNLPGHAACPTIAGITKCIEAECKLALPKNVYITFE